MNPCYPPLLIQEPQIREWSTLTSGPEDRLYDLRVGQWSTPGSESTTLSSIRKDGLTLGVPDTEGSRGPVFFHGGRTGSDGLTTPRLGVVVSHQPQTRIDDLGGSRVSPWGSSSSLPLPRWCPSPHPLLSFPNGFGRDLEDGP